ncbi:MAG: MBL fold metallo-hydrolase [Verrucomicrobiota bacterium]|nr:MBL fold metallo-hydrolase [Limisphaera sp.]MDW8382595.1 MBL fold metallo-hydrolase [Verrucomicrobiota bacterium]
MRITLHGAAGEVTGSAYEVATDQARVLVDFGLFQGHSKTEERNRVPPGLDVSRLDAVLITHAHLDHVGRLPLLMPAGFKGPVYMHPVTVELAGLVLRDAAKVQAQDVARLNRKRMRAGKAPLSPLYTEAEVAAVLAQFEPVEYGVWVEVAPGLRARWINAGHMLGSASIELAAEEAGRLRRVVFSGDVGPPGLALVPDPDEPQPGQLVFLESTYGDRDNKSPAETLAEFRSIIEAAVRQKARLLVPAFAIGRTQQILYHLDELFCAGAVPPFPVYVDSPMALEATEIYARHPDLFDREARALQSSCELVRSHRHVIACPTAEDSMRLNDAPGPCLIMAGSGMCTGGRILHHLKHGLWRPETIVMFVGYQSEGTLGRLLVDGARQVRIFGEEIVVRARIYTLNGFSAHAGQTALLRWLQPLSHARPRVVLTHGEPRGRQPLAARIRSQFGLEVLEPELGDVITL